MRQIDVRGKYTEQGYDLHSIVVRNDGGISDETRNTVYQVLRIRSKVPVIVENDVWLWDNRTMLLWDNNTEIPIKL